MRAAAAWQLDGEMQIDLVVRSQQERVTRFVASLHQLFQTPPEDKLFASRPGLATARLLGRLHLSPTIDGKARNAILKGRSPPHRALGEANALVLALGAAICKGFPQSGGRVFPKEVLRQGKVFEAAVRSRRLRPD
jgi:hypothetical protein